jgi:membrane-associated phospholipid phosphatase
VETYLPGELRWPIWQWMEVFYVTPYALVTIAPMIAPTNRILRRFVLAGYISVAIGTVMFLVVPAVSTPRPFESTNFLGRMMLTDRWLDRNNGSASLPSFHVVWAFLGAWVFAQCQPQRRAVQIACWTWAALVAASCVFTGMHSLLDVVAGFLLFVLLYRALGDEREHRGRAAAPSNSE